MKSKSLSESSFEELINQRTFLKNALVSLAIVMVVAYTTLIAIAIKSRNLALIAIVPSGFVCLLPAFIRLRNVKAEIKKRGHFSNRL